MSLKANVLANYVSQIYGSLIGILMVPLLLRYLGAEAYGLVGFFAMLQAWFQLLDLGFAAAMSREAARWKGGEAGAGDFRRLLRAVEQIFVVIGVVGALAIVAGAPAVAEDWLRPESLDVAEVSRAIALMSLTVMLRWVAGLYRGVISGMERQVWLGVFSTLVATARFVLVIPLFILVGAGPVLFFAYQLALALVELGVLVGKTYRLLPKAGIGSTRPLHDAAFREMLKFALSMAIASAVWILATQSDKLVLSRLLSLSEYGYYSVAALAASGVLLLATPVSTAVLPRLSRLEAIHDEAGMKRLYRDATQLVAVAAVPVALVLAFFPGQLLWSWTGDAATVAKVAPVLALYAAGSGLLVLGAFPYYLQHAKGDLRLHMVGSVLFVMALIPLLVWATSRYGMVGAGGSWLIANGLYFVFWVPIAHRLVMPGLHIQWLLQDIGLPVVPSILGAWVLQAVLPWPEGRGQVALQLSAVGMTLVVLAGLGASTMRRHFFKLLAELACFRSRGH